jgi:hypothetical protein
MLDNQPIRWTEFLKGLLHTFPEEVRLMSLSVSPVSTAPNATAAGAPQIRLEGRLLPTGLSHEIIYAEWVNDMEAIAGLGSVRVASVRELEWKGRQSSLFVIEITPPALTVTGGSL